MNRIFTLIGLLLFSGIQLKAQETTWNGYKISYIGKTSISKKMDGNQNAKLSIQNLSNVTAAPLYFDLYIEGFTAPSLERNLHGEFGWATFPNGGALQIPVGQQGFAQCWTQGAYENKMGNIPPASGNSKTYKIHFLFSENQGALQGPYPKNAATVLDLPVNINFINDDTLQLYRSGSKSLRLVVNPKTAGDFNLELFTESGGPQQSNSFQNTIAQTGNGSNIPYMFDFKLALRNDWFVKIRKGGKKSEYFKLDTAQSTNTISLTEETIETSPYTIRLQKSIKTPTGFWRGAVSESTQTFVCIPGQENRAGTSSLVTASKLYKIDFDGNILWTKDIGWEAWGGDMSADGKLVAVASNGATIPTALNGNRGGDFIAILKGNDGSIYDTIVSGIQSRNVKFSADGKFLAIGDQSGTFHVYDIAQKKIILTKVGLSTYGQNRELAWLDNDNAIVISTGDGYLRRFNLSADKKTASLIWTAYTGGWAFINGLTITKDGLFIGTGTKSKDQTIVNAATGQVVWSKYTGLFDVAFTPNGDRMATFGGYIFRRDNGNLLGHTGRAGVASFSPDGKYLMQADRVQVTNGSFGDNAVTIMNNIGDRIADAEGKSNFYDSLDLTTTGGEQVQWAYWSEDGKRIIVLSRDMDLKEEVGISIFRVETCSLTAPTVTNLTICQGTAASTLNAVASSGNSLLWYGTNLTGGTASSTAPTVSTTNSGQTIYYVSQFNATSGCESKRSALTVTVNPSPIKPTISQSGSDLVSSAATGNVWHKESVEIVGAVDKTFRPTSSGNYTVQVRLNGCNSPMSDNFNYVVTSIVNSSVETSVYKLYPNPVKDRVFLDAGNIAHKINYQLFDAKGSVLLSNSFTKSTLIDLSRFSAGAYTILITNTKTLKQESRQLIKH